MSSTCVASVDLCAVRVASLTEAGAPDTGADNGYVTDAAIKLDVTVELETGDELVQKNGCGAICAVLREPDLIKGISLGTDLCQLDAELLALLTGSDTFTSGGNAIGSQFPAIGATPPPVCFEGWSKAWESGQQAVAPFTDPDPTYIHWVFPYTRWVQGALVVEHALQVVPVTGKGQENESITVNGPFDDWPTAIADQGGVTRIGGWFYDAAIPTVACNTIEVTSAAS
jgi:hypothetical protein